MSDGQYYVERPPLAPEYLVSTGEGSFVRAGAIYAVANVLSAAVPFLLLPLLTRVLDASQYGQITIFFVVFTFSSALAGLSLHGAVGVRWFDTDPAQFPQYVSSCIAVSIASTLLAAALVVGGMRLAGVDLGLPDLWIVLAIVAAGSNSILQFRLVLWQSQGRPLKAAGLQFTNSIVNVGLSVLGVIGLGLGAAGRMGGACIAFALMAILAVTLLVRDGMVRGLPSKQHMTSALRFGVPLVPHALAAAVMATADRFFVAERLGTTAVGIYGVAAQLGMVMAVFSSAFEKTYSPWMYARLSRATADDELALVGTTYLCIPFFLALAAVIGGLLSVLGPVILGDEFHAAVPLVWWFMLGGAFTGMYYSVTGFFFFSSRTELVSVVTGSSSLIGLPLCYWLVGARGMEGGAIAFAATQALLFSFAFAFAMRMRKMPWRQISVGVSKALVELRGR